jgi:hypothetical protein
MSGDWRQRGACRTGDPDRFFTTKGRPPPALVNLCRACESLIPCTFDALRQPTLGIQAGMSKPERDRVRRWDRQARKRLEARGATNQSPA